LLDETATIASRATREPDAAAMLTSPPRGARGGTASKRQHRRRSGGIEFAPEGPTSTRMSRAFVKDSERPDPLPEIPLSEHPNRTTPAGLARQQQRLADLRAVAQTDDASQDELARLAIAREIRWLEARIAAAVVVDPQQQPAGRVAFGARVDLLDEHGNPSSYRIVGEDEADAEHGSVSWVSPLARAVIGAKVGDEVLWRRPAGDLRLEIVAIRYGED